MTDGGEVPSWQPDWTDVRFDHVACEAAVAACRSASAQLEAAADAQVAAADRARADWTGATERRFDAAATQAIRDQHSLMGQLEALATALETGAQAALDEQAARDRDRERWRDERGEVGTAGAAATSDPVPTTSGACVRTVTAAVGMVVVLVLVACGGSDDEAPSTASDPGTPAATAGAPPRPVPADGVDLAVVGTVDAASTGQAYELTLTVTNRREDGITVLPLADGPAETHEEGGAHVVRVFLPVADPASDARSDAPPAVDGVAVAPGEQRRLSSVVGLTLAPPIDLVVCLEVASSPGLDPDADTVTLVLPEAERAEVDAVCSEPTTIG